MSVNTLVTFGLIIARWLQNIDKILKLFYNKIFIYYNVIYKISLTPEPVTLTLTSIIGWSLILLLLTLQGLSKILNWTIIILVQNLLSIMRRY